MRPLTRRRLLQVSLGGMAAVGLGLAGWRWSRWNRGNRGSGRGHGQGSALQTVSRTSRALGAEVSITALHTDAAVAERAINAAFAELQLVEDLMSIYRSDSQLSRLNRDGFLANPHPHLLTVLRHATATSQRTGGAFDVTVQPLWQVYARAKAAGSLPEAKDLSQACAKVNWRRFSISDQEICLLDGGMAITLNGIAQGFAADRVAAVLRTHGIEHALVDAGELSALGSKTIDEPWKVGIQHPREEDAYIALAGLTDRCLATSGDYELAFNDDKTRHHIFDPRTGLSPTQFASVSIAAPTAMQADALSTAVFVLGLDEGLALIEKCPGVDAMFVLRDGSVRRTAGFPGV